MAGIRLLRRRRQRDQDREKQSRDAVRWFPPLVSWRVRWWVSWLGLVDWDAGPDGRAYQGRGRRKLAREPRKADPRIGAIATGGRTSHHVGSEWSALYAPGRRPSCCGRGQDSPWKGSSLSPRSPLEPHARQENAAISRTRPRYLCGPGSASPDGQIDQAIYIAAAAGTRFSRGHEICKAQPTYTASPSVAGGRHDVASSTRPRRDAES